MDGKRESEVELQASRGKYTSVLLDPRFTPQPKFGGSCSLVLLGQKSRSVLEQRGW